MSLRGILGGQRQTDQYAAHIFLRVSLITCRACCVVISLPLLTVMKLKHIAIVTSAVYSISKSIFARAVIGSPGVVADSTISTTVVCWVGTLVDILNKKRNLTEKRLIDMV